MPPPMPAPDPFEPSWAPPDPELPIASPMAVFMMGPPTPEIDRLSDAILAARPGVVFICRRA